MHRELNINYLKIEVEEGNDFSSYTNVHIEGMRLKDHGKVELSGDKTLEIKWSRNDTGDYEAKQGMKDADGLNKERDSNPLEESGEKSFKEDKARNLLESGNLNGKNEFLWIDDFDGLVNKVQELKASNRWGEKEVFEE